MNPTKKIAIILTVIFLLPALFFSVYEMSSLSKDEKMIEDIYQKQLEAILFSVNQYSDDVLSSWITKIQIGSEANAGKWSEEDPLQNFMALNSAVQVILMADTSLSEANARVWSLESATADSLRGPMLRTLQGHQEQIRQLIRYKKSGFQKIQAFQMNGGNAQLVCFIIDTAEGGLQVTSILINAESFVEDLIGPRLQVIAKDQFVLSVFRKTENRSVYSTATGDTTSFKSEALTKDLWTFSDYALGIHTQGASIQQLVRERTTTNLYLLVGLDIILVVALVLAFRSVKKEVQLAQNKADFVSNVSHEIRTPLALISMFAETLEMGRAKSEEKKQEYYSIINKETHRLSGIVNKILNFSQTEAGKKKLHLETVDLVHQVKDILTTYDFHLRNKGFDYSFVPLKDVRVLADKEAFIEIMVNLIDNAVKYSIDIKKIEITAGTGQGMGWVAVKDYGVGISKSDQKHIFDKFYRVSSGNLAKSRGTGLGLSLVKQLVEQQKGLISVTSELGKGSTFTVYFPQAD